MRHRLTFRLAPVALAAVTLGAACIEGSRAPTVAPRGTLAPGGAEAALARKEGPFGVVFAAPRGPTVDPSEITLVFNRPMRPLDLAGQEAAAPVTIKPAVRGRWSWVGTSGLSFIPEAGHELPRATEYVVEVPAGTKALDGSVMDKPFVLRFSTVRPKVVSLSATSARGASSDNESLEPDSVFDLRFNQPVDDAELLRALTLSAGDQGQKISFEVKRPDPKNELLVQIAPKSRLPLDAPIDLVFDASLRGREGPLPAGEAQRFDLHTYGKLAFDRILCNNDTPGHQCSAEGGFSIELTNPVKLADLKKAVKLDPAVKIRWPSWLDDDQASRSVQLWGRFVPGKTYGLKISASALKDVHGQTLTADVDQKVSFDDLWPSAEIGLTGSIFEPSAKKGIPIASVNTKEIELATARLSEESILALQGDLKRGPHDPRFDEIQLLPGAKVVRLKPSAAVNKAAEHLVLTDDVLGGKDKRGPLAIGIRYTERPGTRFARPATRNVVAQVTDLAISAKISQKGSLVWVTHLGTAAPVEGASVKIAVPGAQGAAVFKTDQNGFAQIPSSAFTPAQSGPERAVIFASTSDDFAYRRVTDMLSGWRFGASADFGPDHPIGMLFTDRGIYRPGDTVRIKGIFREEARSGTSTPANRPVELSVNGPEGESLQKLTPTLGAFGTFSVDVKVPDTGRLGTYAIQATMQGSPHDYADVSADFEVAEYRPAEFKVSVQSDKPSYIRGDKATWTARGDYLFGAPMAKADVHLDVSRSESWFSPPMPENFSSGDQAFLAGQNESSERGTEVQSGSSKLDDKGSFGVGAALTMPGQRGPELVTCEADVTDLSRQMISGSTSAIVHPGEFYLGMNAGPDLFVKPSDPVKPQILAVDPKGARVAGVNVTIELIQRKWNVARQEVGGVFRNTVSTADHTVSTCSLTTTNDPASCSLQPSGAGFYVVRAKAADKRGNPVASSTELYVTGDAGDTSWADNDQQKLDLVPDRKSYEIGQTAHILVKSPFKTAEALVTVERAGIYVQKKMTLSGPMPTLDIPVTEDLRPNAFVSVLLVKGRSKAAPGKTGKGDIGAPAFRFGYAPVPINPEARRLKLALKANKTEFRPGEAIEVDVDVKDRAGKPARSEVTLYAVDEGVLSLIGYKTPDPIPVFGAPRSLKVATIEAREVLAKVMNPFAALGLDKGLEGGGGGKDGGVRRDFRSSAYFNPTLVTDDKGHIHASFKLPDSLTTYRLMAVAAAEDDRFGYAESNVTTSRPLMGRPAFPRFLRAGDSLEAGVVVTSKGLAKSKIDVEIKAEGIVVKDGPVKSIDLDANASSEVRFAIDAPKAGPAKVSFTVKGGGAEDRVEITRDVQVPQVVEAVALYGDTTTQSAEKLGDLAAIRDDVGGLSVGLSSTALVGLDNGLEHLVDYPYGCTEQLTSRLVPMLPLRGMADDYKLSMPKDLDRIVNKTVADILAHQRGDGSFGLWAESPDGSPWVTAYALWGLSIAKKNQVAVPQQALDDATRYLRDALPHLDKDELLLASGPFMLDVLADNGAPAPGWVSTLFEKRSKLPLFSQAMLLHAMVSSKMQQAQIDMLATEIEGKLRLDANTARAVANEGDRYAVLMDSDTRTSALVLRGLLAARPDHPLAGKLAMGLLADRKGGTWRNTQETAWSLLALDDYRKVQEKVSPNFTAHVFLGEKELFTAPFQGRSLKQETTSIRAADLIPGSGAPLAFDVQGQGRLFYEARLRYAKKTLPRVALERGFFVKKTLRAVSASALDEALKIVPESSVSSFKGGDLVLCDLVIVTPSPRTFVVIDDPLPAGFEAVDAKLATTGKSYDVDSAEEPGGDDDDDSDDNVARGTAYRSSSFLREIRDDRVLFFVDHLPAGMFRYRYLARATSLGAFVVPPTKAEEMYTPEVFGRTGSDLVRINAK
ncbi:MAG: MG2 domain-containing protein [Byssovorax sp.]